MKNHLKVQSFPAVFLAACFLLFLILPAAAEDSSAIGRIIALRGQATISAADGAVARPLALKSAIRIGESIKTGPRCRLQILFLDNTIVSLGPDSEFLVKDYAWDAGSGQGKMNSRVNEGAFRVLGGSITRSAPQNFLTETPSATIGIRGSMFAGRLHEGSLQVLFQGGKGIFVQNDLGTVDISIPGFGTRVAGPGQAPVQPYRLPQAELDQLAAGPTEPMTASDSGSDGSLAGDEKPLPQRAESLPRQEILPTTEPPQQQRTDQLPTPDQPPTPGQLPDPHRAIVTGGFMAAQQDDDLAANIADRLWTGNLSGETADGVLSVVASTNDGSVAIGDLPVAVYDPTQSYSGESKLTDQSRQVLLLDTLTLFNSAAVASDNAGEFAIFALEDLFNNTYSYREIGFAGTPNSSLPNTDIDHFHGPLLVTLDLPGGEEFESFSSSFQLFVNWHNNKLVGVVQAPGSAPDNPKKAVGFFFGDVNGAVAGEQFSNIRFVGMDVVGDDLITPNPDLPIAPEPGMPLTIDGSTSFGQFYGSQTQGVGLIARGQTLNVMSQLAEEDWLLTAAGFRGLTTMSAAAGIQEWEGFAVGIGEDMNQIDGNRRLYMNQQANDFRLTIDRDNGTVSGSLTVADQDDSSALISNLQIGGGEGSAYIFDQLLVAGVGGAAPIQVGNNRGPLKTYGNYLLTENPNGQQLASYASWGTWEIAYSEPGSGKDYHVHNPGSLWIAGEPTPAADLTALAALNITGTYSGTAEGVRIPSFGAFDRLPGGTCSLTIDFGTGMLTSGAISFPADARDGLSFPTIDLAMDPTVISGNGFSTAISTPGFGSVNGAFFGPNAASAAGNFDARDGTFRYLGVFGGDR